MSMSTKKTIKEEPTTEMIANQIQAISKGVKELKSGKLNEKCLLILIQQSVGCVGRSKLSITQIKAVLNGIENLGKEFLK